MDKKVTLELAFIDGFGKTKRLNIANPKSNISPQTAQATLEAVSTSGAFEDYQVPVSARYITRQVDELYVA